MATISNLVVNLIARTSVFERRMNRSRRSVHNLQRTAYSAQRRIMGFARGLLAAAGIAGVGYLINKTMKAIDATAKFSDRIGIATEDLIALRHAASLAGSTSENLDKGLEVMTRRLGETSMGVGQARYALDLLNLSSEALIKQNPAENFETIAKAIVNLPTYAEKAAAAYYLMGRKGMELLNLMERVGKEGLEPLNREAEKLGITFSRFDAAKVEAANDSITRLKALFQGVLNILVIELSPAVEAFANHIVDSASEGKGLKATMLDLLESVSLGFLEAGHTVDMISVKWTAFRAGVQEGLAEIYDFMDSISNLDILFKDLGITDWTWAEEAVKARENSVILWEEAGDLAQDYQDNVNKLRAAFEKMRDTSGDTNKRLSSDFLDLIEKVEDINEGLQRQVELHGLNAREAQYRQLVKLADRLSDTEKTIFLAALENTRALVDELNRLDETATRVEERRAAEEDLAAKAKRIYESTRTPIERYINSLNELNDMLDAGLITWDTFDRAVDKLNEDLISTGDAMERIRQKAGELRVIRPGLVAIAGLGMGLLPEREDMPKRAVLGTPESEGGATGIRPEVPALSGSEQVVQRLDLSNEFLEKIELNTAVIATKEGLG